MRILNAALELMTERGFDEVKISDIAERADIANATFFLHYPTKTALIAAFNEQVSQKIVDRLSDFDLPAIEQLELLRAITLDEWSRYGEPLRGLISEAFSQDSAVLTQSSASLSDLVEAIVRKGQAEGEISEDFDADIVAESLVASWRAATVRWAIDGDRIRARRANQQALDIFLSGIANR